MIQKVKLTNFRNHKDLTIAIDKPTLYIGGENGSGKTSILESLYLISTGKSHRTNSDEDMIKYTEKFAKVEVETNDKTYEVVISNYGKRLFINGTEIKRVGDFIGNLKVVIFSPDDLSLINGSPSIRRDFVDLEIMKLDKEYLYNFNKYRNVLRQRNSLLKRMKIDDDFTFLDILSEQLIHYATKIMQKREEFIDKMNESFKKMYKKLNNGEVSFEYLPNMKIEQLKTHLFKRQKQDIILKTTNAGIHRDDYRFLRNDKDVKFFSSQGEKRLIVIALKLALITVINKITNEDVVMLLDDVLSELDDVRQKIFLENIPKNFQLILNSVQNIENDDIQKIYLERN